MNNLTVLKAIKEKAESLGLKAKILTDNLKGDVKDIAKLLLNEINKSKFNILLAGGETTVKVKGKGKGGRNQELVLWFLKYLEHKLLTNKNTNYSRIGIISINSDSWDNTEFAGAISDKITLENAIALNLNIEKFLENNDSFNFFKRVGDGIITGRLPINLSDFMLILKN